MKSVVPLVVAVFLLDAGNPSAATAEPANSATRAALAAAGRSAILKMIDYGSDYCDGDVTVEEWLKALVGKQARATAWSGGPCQLVNHMRPGIDASSWPYCAQATIRLVHPLNKDDTPMVEIYFEKPDHGHLGTAYAFRGVLMTRDGDPDYIRFRKDFEAGWNERFPAAGTSPRCKDD
jgi:hypothetical protein